MLYMFGRERMKVRQHLITASIETYIVLSALTQSYRLVQ